MRVKYIFFVLSACLLWSCADEQSAMQIDPSRYFTLAQMKKPNPGGRSAQTAEEPATAFNLGDLRASKEFLFLLGNAADQSIFNVKLSVDNPSFTVSPKQISELPGRNADNTSLLPLVSVGAIHGRRLDGVGTTAIMDMGTHNATVTLEGKIVSNGDSITVRSTFVMTLDAKVMDAALYSDGQEKNLAIPDNTWGNVGDESGLSYRREYYVTWATAQIKNTGNVPFTLIVIEAGDVNGDGVVVNVAIAMQPGETIKFADHMPNPAYAKVIFDGQGTITDLSRLQLGTDGRAYMSMDFYN